MAAVEPDALMACGDVCVIDAEVPGQLGLPERKRSACMIAYCV